MNWLGLDVGGANLKVADGRGWAKSVPFPLWRDPDRLATALRDLIRTAPQATHVAVTMTGELCDCFRTKREGVEHILTALEPIASTREVQVYLVDGRLVSLDVARLTPELAAASNWHALARYAGRFATSSAALLIDIGSTTTDIVPLVHGAPRPTGLNDTERLLAAELVYSGVGRTPVCAITSSFPWRGEPCAVAAEFFATTADAYVILGELPERPDTLSTADGRPLTREFSRERLARMICADRTIFDEEAARLAAEHVRETQTRQITSAARRVAASLPHEPQAVLASGQGEFLALPVCRSLWPNVSVRSLASIIGSQASLCAPAYALAVLAPEITGNP